MVSNLTESSAQNALKLLQDLLNFCSACLFLLCMDFSKAYSAFFFFQFISLSSAPQPPLKIIKCSQLVFKSLIPLTLPGTLMNYLLTTRPSFPGVGRGEVPVSRPCLESPQLAGCNDSPFLFFSAIASILRAWLDQCAEDFREPPHFPCLQKLLDYLKQMMPGSDPERRAQNLLEQFHKQELETDSEYSPDSREESPF